MFRKKTNKNLKEIRIEEITYYKLCILVDEKGYKDFTEAIEELLKK